MKAVGKFRLFVGLEIKEIVIVECVVCKIGVFFKLYYLNIVFVGWFLEGFFKFIILRFFLFGLFGYYEVFNVLCIFCCIEKSGF